MTFRRLFPILLLLAFQPAFAEDALKDQPAPNTLTDAEKKDGWKLLFDGKTTAGWRGYKMKEMPPGWSVENGAMCRLKGGAGGKGAGGGDDIVTVDEYESFDLKIEWKIVAKGNSGILYHVSEEPVTAWHFAPEMQVLDNGPWEKRDKRQLAGACYDLYAPARDATRKIGQWNEARLIVDGPKVQHFLNGEKMCEYVLWSDDWKDRVSKSKFKVHSKFGTFKKGFICLQDHSDRIEFRNIKIKVMEGKSAASIENDPGRQEKVDLTQLLMQKLENRIEELNLHMNRYPTKAEGLDTLMKKPANEEAAKRWRGPYVDKEDIVDAWGNRFNYDIGKEGMCFKLWSNGPDGKSGSKDDIRNWIEDQ